MKMTIRGIIFFGLYVFLVTLPLSTAVLSDPTRESVPLIVNVAVKLASDLRRVCRASTPLPPRG